MKNKTQAFPWEAHEGMTLRDYFAGQVIIAICSGAWAKRREDMAIWAYKIADAMLEEREKD